VSRRWPAQVEDVFRRLESYELVGASACVREIVLALGVVAQVARRRGDVVAEVAEAGRAFCALKPETAVYREAVAWLIAGLDDAAPDVAAARIQLRAASFGDYQAACLGRLLAHGERLLEVEAVLVHDYSSTVAAVLRHARSRGRRLRVVATAAEPVGGGLRLAREAAAAGHRAVLVPDTAAARVLDEVDLVLTGVETAYLDGALANTVGTYAVALLAREASVPVYAATECIKIAPGPRPRNHAELRARLLHGWPAQPLAGDVEIRTEVLDLTPPELLAGYLTERGLLGPDELGAAYRAFRDELDRLAADA
jgi:translation initiation factor 2B subunit (eIF-2B alpha/beta/delta family)